MDKGVSTLKLHYAINRDRLHWQTSPPEKPTQVPT